MCRTDLNFAFIGRTEHLPNEAALGWEAAAYVALEAMEEARSGPMFPRHAFLHRPYRRRSR